MRWVLGLLWGAALCFALAGLASGCAHFDDGDDDRLWLAKAKCDRDIGQWVVEYDMHGNPMRYACIHRRLGQ